MKRIINAPQIQWKRQEIKKFICIITLGKGKNNNVTIPPQWDGFLVVLNASDSEFSLSMVQKTQDVLNSMGAQEARKIVAEMRMIKAQQ